MSNIDLLRSQPPLPEDAELPGSVTTFSIIGFEHSDNGYWSAKPEPRSRYRALTQMFDVALIARGHIHRARDLVVDGIQFVWCPSTAFVVGPDLQPPLPGDKAWAP